MDLPSFRYHPDPLASGSIESSEAVCACCSEARGFIYTGSVYGKREVEALCPWCIANGEAHRQFGVIFSSLYGLDGVPEQVQAEIEQRTPGYLSWQEERWLAHHGDACAFLGPAGRKEIEAYASDTLVASLRADMAMMSDEYFAEYYAGMDREGQPTAYVFQCLHCGILLGYSDST